MVKVDSNKHMRPPSCRRIVWVAYAKICTLFIPDKLLIYLSNGRLTTKVRREAWREKFALFLSYLLTTAIFCFWLEFITTLFCDPPKTYDYDKVYANNSHVSTINGQVVDWHNLGNLSEMTFEVNQYPGMDLSPMFPLFMQLQRPPNQQTYSNRIIDECINGFNRSAQADNWLNYKLTHDPGYVYSNNQLVSCPIPGQRNETGTPCFYSMISQQEYDRYHKKGAVKYDPDVIYNNFSALPYRGTSSSAYVILDDKVLDVTDYLDAATNIVKVAKGAHSRSFALDRMFLPLDLTIMLFVNMGIDITDQFVAEIANADQYRECLYQLFFHGVVDGDKEEGCAHINVALWITMGCFLLYFLLKMNLANLSRLSFMQRLLFKSVPSGRRLTTTTMSTTRYLPPYTLLFIPCYAESSETIKQTFDSLARTSYPDTRKLLFFVCDGLAKSDSDGKETYLCILESLGYSSTKDPELRSYISLGQGSRRINYAKVYAGFYESGRNRVPFLMIVKVGTSVESLYTTRTPGTRGKRDSMVIVLSFLERCMNLSHNRIAPLEFELFNQCYNLLGIDPRWLKYMLVTDADTQVQDDVVIRLVSRLEADHKLLAVSGHIRPANPEENIITMLQIFPLYMTFYSGLAYEASLGSVTTINGGFVMYRLWAESISTSPSPNNIYKMKQLDHLTPQQQQHQLSKWPKVSDEIIVPENTTVNDWQQNPPTKKSPYAPDDEEDDDIDYDDDDTSSDDNLTTTNTTSSSRNKINSSRRRMFTKKKKMPPPKKQDSVQHFSLTPNKDVIPICIQPTVLRGFAAPRPDTMHMENVLLLGEEQYFGIVLLRSHPQHRLGFEPEAIAYATIPTNFFALQALQLRIIRSTFHNLIEFQHVAKHLGFMYWVMAFTKLTDMIFSMPIIVYLYGIFIRYFMYKDLAYEIIAGSFTGLIILHIFYFILRRQFKYVLWFIIYGLFSVPLFNVYFPLMATWCSDYANRWYDVWPTKNEGYHSRLHGIVMDESTEGNMLVEEEEEEEAEEVVVRMRLSDFEILEAERMAQREKEQVEMLDAKFNGFTGYAASSHGSKPSWSSANDFISSPPLAQMRDGYTSVKMKSGGGHSRFASEDDARFLLSPNRSSTPRTSSMNSVNSINSPRNPFASVLDDPFDDVYGEVSFNKPVVAAVAALSHHKPSKSQSSYFSRSSNDYHYPQDMFAPNSENGSMMSSSNYNPAFTTTTNSMSSRMRSFSTSSAVVVNNRPYNFYSHHQPVVVDNSTMKDNNSVISLTNSVISLERDAQMLELPVLESEQPPQHTLGHRRRQQQQQQQQQVEGRSAPVHSRIVLQQQQP